MCCRCVGVPVLPICDDARNGGRAKASICVMGVSVTEDSDREGPEQLAEFQGRDYDQEHVEEPEKTERKRSWLPDPVSVVIDVVIDAVTSWP